MKKYRPQQSVLLIGRLFFGGVITSILIGGLINIYRMGMWTTNEWIGFIVALIFSVLIRYAVLEDIHRQLACEISEDEFRSETWSFRFLWPFLFRVPEVFLWSEVRTIGRSGYTMFLYTPVGRKTVNLFLFERPDEVGLFIHGRWISSGNKINKN